MDLAADDLVALDRRLIAVDGLADAWPDVPPQITAHIALARAGRHLLAGDPDAAESHLRDAASAAFASHDQPVIGQVALSLGLLAVARGDIPKAVRAVELATALIGVHDATNPHVRVIERAAADAGIGRPDAVALTRPKALEALEALVSEA